MSYPKRKKIQVYNDMPFPMTTCDDCDMEIFIYSKNMGQLASQILCNICTENQKREDYIKYLTLPYINHSKRMLKLKGAQ